MKTMTFNGRTMREAIALAKARFGAEVDILDSGAVGDEVQVTVVVPSSRSAARRRRAIEQVSSGINALAASGPASAVVRPVVEDPGLAGAEALKGSSPGGAVQQAAEAAEEAGQAARAAMAGTTAADAKAVDSKAEPGKTRKKAAKGTKTTRAGTRAARTEHGAATAAGVESGGEAARREGQATTGESSNDEPTNIAGVRAGTTKVDAVPVPGLKADAPPLAAAATQAAAPVPGQPMAMQAAEAAGAVSTLDFELQRRLRQQEQRQADTSPQALVMPGTASAADQVVMAMPGAWTPASPTVPSVAPAPAMPGAPAAPGGMGPAAVAAHVSQAPRSRLWAMVDSARRMFRRRRPWLTSGEVGDGSMVPPTGFAEVAPMSLASTLGSDGADWPSLQLPGLEAQGGLAQTRQAAAPATAESSGLGWFETVRRRPGQMRLLRTLLDCQFSPALARTLVGLLPVDYGDVQADEWLRQTLLRALAGVNTTAGLSSGVEQGLFDRGGVFALIGPTGVGKTTSIAKIAAHHVLRHGPRQLALITADVYRIGAQEQLRAFGRMLGVPVQVAQDRDVLQALLKEHEDRSLVLIDTAGIGQRDDRVAQLTAALELSQVKRVLVMNAAAQAGSLEEVLDAFGARDTAGVLLSKVDEAVGLGSCLDAMVRHRLPLVGYTDGQRVPEDYHPANFAQLIEQALTQRVSRRFHALAMTDSELRNLFEDTHV